MNEEQNFFWKNLREECNNMDNPQNIHFCTPDELQKYLENTGKEDLNFQAYPISGTPENFHFDGHEEIVTRERDGFSFETMEDFLCYTFQCDTEGYTHTEYVDVKFNQQE